jgi:UDP-N-acetylmuramoyl-tripeptide--D-alanyl-D-alanine ligase
VLAALTGAAVHDVHDGLEPLDRAITAVVIDSRLAQPGALFVALRGEHTDGHAYVGAAFERGAHVALVERDVELAPEAGVRVIDARGPLNVQALVAAHGPICVRVAHALEALQNVAAYWRERHAARVVGVTGSVGKTTNKELIASVLARRYRVLRSGESQ